MKNLMFKTLMFESLSAAIATIGKEKVIELALSGQFVEDSETCWFGHPDALFDDNAYDISWAYENGEKIAQIIKERY